MGAVKKDVGLIRSDLHRATRGAIACIIRGIGVVVLSVKVPYGEGM